MYRSNPRGTIPPPDSLSFPDWLDFVCDLLVTELGRYLEERRPWTDASPTRPGVLRRFLDRPELPVDEDPFARDISTVDMQALHHQPALCPADLECHSDRHGVVGRFEDPDRTRDLAVADGPCSADVSELTCHRRPVPREAPSPTVVAAKKPAEPGGFAEGDAVRKPAPEGTSEDPEEVGDPVADAR
jgi:hypothetical protein